MLTGVNIGDFGKTTGEHFIDLVCALDGVRGIRRYRISSLEPDLCSDELIDFCAHSHAFMPHFHIPLQSGSDAVLKLMHRHYNRQLFADKILRIKERMPDAWSPAYRQRIAEKRALLPQFDVVHGMDQTRVILHFLLNSNPANKMALDYLLCLDLLGKDLDAFVEDYDPSLTGSRLYEEAMLIFLAAKGGMTEENLRHYRISPATFERFNRFVAGYKRDNGSGRNLTGEFGKSYWYYFYYAVRNEQH